MHTSNPAPAHPRLNSHHHPTPFHLAVPRLGLPALVLPQGRADDQHGRRFPETHFPPQDSIQGRHAAPGSLGQLPRGGVHAAGQPDVSARVLVRVCVRTGVDALDGEGGAGGIGDAEIHEATDGRARCWGAARLRDEL